MHKRIVVHPKRGILLGNFRATKSMTLRSIMLSEINERQKAKCCMIPFIWHSKTNKDKDKKQVGD